VGVAYYYRSTQNVQTTANINAPLTDYTPTSVYLSGANAGQAIINPLTGLPITLYALTGNVTGSCAAAVNNTYTPTGGTKYATDNGCGWTETTIKTRKITNGKRLCRICRRTLFCTSRPSPGRAGEADRFHLFPIARRHPGCRNR